MAGHVARMGTKISGHRVLVGKSNWEKGTNSNNFI
jgi:hypothetical protein